MTGFIAREKLYGHLDRLQQLRAGHTEAPVNVEIDLSNRCSLGCEWCHFAYTHTRGPLSGKRAKPAGAILGGDLMTIELAESMIDQLVEAGVRSLTWTGGGEPTLHPEFDRIIRYAGGRVAQGIYTHGGHIDDERAALLKRTLAFAYVSLDAANAESYKRDKGVDRFAAACEGIRRLVVAPGAATVGVGFLVTETNWPEIPAMVDLGKTLASDYIQFRPAILYDAANPSLCSEDTHWLTNAIMLLEEYAGPNVEADLERFRMYRDWGGHGYGTCWWSMLQTCITPNGKVWACVNKREHPGAEIGDLSQESFAEVWARHTAVKVGADCRVMCRGHLPNLSLAAITADHPHPAFI